jgi:hypothetical protein
LPSTSLGSQPVKRDNLNKIGRDPVLAITSHTSLKTNYLREMGFHARTVELH